MGYPMIFDEDREQARKEKHERRVTRHEESLTWVMSQPQGRAFVRWLLEASGAMGQTFDRDTQVSAFNEGKRAVGLAILERLTHPKYFEQYVTLLKEQQNHE